MDSVRPASGYFHVKLKLNAICSAKRYTQMPTCNETMDKVVMQSSFPSILFRFACSGRDSMLEGGAEHFYIARVLDCGVNQEILAFKFSSDCSLQETIEYGVLRQPHCLGAALR
jgi:hypothetical protein